MGGGTQRSRVCHWRELARILFITFGTPIDHKTVKTLWQESLVACQGHLALWDYHAHPDCYEARLQVIQLYYRGWDKISISRFLHVSRPTSMHGSSASRRSTSPGWWTAAVRRKPRSARFGCP
jgi:crotonobetainyl-CoA:carnitine CoA-transferase CaiB-like acyl-CoA transferase